MKIRKLLHSTSLTAIAALTIFLSACALQSDLPYYPESPVRSVEPLMTPEEVSKMMFMGGSVLYSSKDSNANQLSSGVIIATRIGKVEKINTGGGNYAYRNSQSDFEYGYIKIESVSKEKISFAYYKFSRGSKKAFLSGSYNLGEDQSADLTGDGKQDVIYKKPDPGRKGRKNNMWLTFLCDADEGNGSMFSVIPVQYERSAYPNGLLGINSNGQFVITKYDVGTSNRAAVSSISPGDYIFDMENNTIGVYTGEARNGRSARSINDDEFQTVTPVNENSKPEDFMYHPNEFIDEFDIKELLSLMPKSIVTEDYSSRSITENVAYLNRLISNPVFITNLVDANSGSVADEIKAQLATGISSEVERIIFNRHSMALFYPENAPDVNVMASTLAGAIPWLEVNINATDYDEDNSRSAIDSALKSRDARNQMEHAYADKMNKYIKEAKEKYAAHPEFADDYRDYLIERDAAVEYFSENLVSINLCSFFAIASELAAPAIKDIVKNSNSEIKIGFGGRFSFANGNPDITIIEGALLRFDLENNFAVTLPSGSFFSRDEPEKYTPAQTKEKLLAKYPGASISEADAEEWNRLMSSKEIMSDQGLDNILFMWKEGVGNAVQGDTNVRPTKDALSFHRFIQPIKTIPAGFTFDMQFDLLYSIKLVVEFNGLHAGGYYLEISEYRFGVDWGFRDYFTFFGKKLAPKVWTFYADPYSACMLKHESKFFAGYTKKDHKDAYVGGGISVILTPVIEFRLGVGIGADIAVAAADFSVGAWVNFALPCCFELAFGVHPETHKVSRISDVQVLFQISRGVDLQLCVDPPILDKKYFKYPLPVAGKTYPYQLCHLRRVGDNLVIKEGVKDLTKDK